MINKDLSTTSGRKAYILGNWDMVASLAYAGYQAYDRGAIVFAIGSPHPMYVPLKENNFGNKLITEAIKKYDTEKEILVLFFLGESEPILEIFREEHLPPPLAYKKFESK